MWQRVCYLAPCMHTYNDTQHLPYSCQQLFELVLDIERYPEFLPWCRAARILERREDALRAELVICFKHITESYVSEVTFKRPVDVGDHGSIHVELVQGPFEHLTNHWVFKSLGPHETEISLHLSFKFRSRILDSLIGLLFGNASSKMVNAFKKRADTLYASDLTTKKH